MGMFTEVHPEIDSPDMVEAEIVAIIEDIKRQHPRGRQSAIGPSEVGHPCTRKLIHKIAGHRAPAGYSDGWASQVGTWGHAGMEAGVRSYQDRQNWDQPRYLMEHRVTVGSACGIDITGHADLFDVLSGTVVDYKFVGPTPLMKYKLHGPGPQYRRQAHLYGRGFALQGYTVKTVMIAFLPRSGELGTSRFTRAGDGAAEWENRGKRFFWSEPYDEGIALAALARLNGLGDLMNLVGVDALLEMYPECEEYFCPWCGR